MSGGALRVQCHVRQNEGVGETARRLWAADADRLAGSHAPTTDQGPHALSSVDSEAFLGMKAFGNQKDHLSLAFPLPGWGTGSDK